MLLFVNTFIKRPVLTTVCTLVILLVGGITIPILPIAQLPDIAPTQVQVRSTYIGADAKTVEDTVTTPLERQINGVEGMKYISSSSNNDGSSNITVTFGPERNKDLAAVDVQNRVSLALATLPESVKQTGVTTKKASTNILLVYGLYSENNEYDNIFLSNYADLFILDAIKRIPGVGDASIFGERKYSMRLWVDPDKLAARQLTALDVSSALREQNIQVGIGAIGQQPAPKDLQYQITLRAESRMKTVQEFDNLVLKTSPDGTLVKLKDVGKAELGAQDYSSSVFFNGKSAVGIGIYQLPGSNALKVANSVKAEIDKLSKDFPPGMKTSVAYDTTLFVKVSIEEVVKTLFEAIFLVVLVIFIFLQDWRTTIIPSVAIPVALIGAFACMKVANFSINTLTLFGMVLATGLVVDDAIIVVESVSVKISEGMKPRQAAIESMKELTGAVIATSVVLMAVFIPVAFFPGSTGIIYQQFAMTIAFSVAFSTFNALSFSPSMSGVLLRKEEGPPGGRWLGWFFKGFNWGFERMQRNYTKILHFLAKIKGLVMVGFIVGLALTVWMFQVVPSGFIPEEDQGYFIVIVQGPDGVSLNYTERVTAEVQKEILKNPEVQSSLVINAFGFDGSAANKAILFNILKPWEERQEKSQSVYGVLQELNSKFFQIPDAQVFAVNAPPVQGLSSFSGFEFQLQNRSGGSLNIDNLIDSSNNLIGKANQNPILMGVFTQFSATNPQLIISVDRDKAKALDVDISQIFGTLQTYLGGQYVNDFVFGQQQYRVYVQADQNFRSRVNDINKLYVRSSRSGEMIPLGNFVKITSTSGPPTINHYNLFQAIKIQGQAKPGLSSGQAIQAMQQSFQQVAEQGIGYEWTGTALEELQAGGQTFAIFALGTILVFLVLSAQYESYIDPLIIMITVPLAILGALIGQSLRGLQNDVYCQIGLVMLIGLASKNAILIVEFANQARQEGLSITESAIKAGTERLRPILMTACSSLMGFYPLVIATGAGAASRNSLGTVVFWGMVASTFLTLLIVPNLYIVIKTIEQWFLDGDKPKKPKQKPSKPKYDLINDFVAWVRNLIHNLTHKKTKSSGMVSDDSSLKDIDSSHGDTPHLDTSPEERDRASAPVSSSSEEEPPQKPMSSD
ncbi:MAG: efflux RND transporter permease subunit [Microcoleaceae cyanobacterium]